MRLTTNLAVSVAKCPRLGYRQKRYQTTEKDLKRPFNGSPAQLDLANVFTLYWILPMRRTANLEVGGETGRSAWVSSKTIPNDLEGVERRFNVIPAQQPIGPRITNLAVGGATGRCG